MRTSLQLVMSATVVSLLALNADAQQADDAKLITLGKPAPSFTLKDDQGKDWKSSDHFGKGIVVLYFYPADMTGGCTKQACGYRDNLDSLKAEGIEVVGISGDSVRNHQLFKKAHNLNFTLLADPQGEVAQKYGVPMSIGEKSVTANIDGKDEVLVRTATTQRFTIVVGKDGQVTRAYKVSDAGGDSQTILDEIAKLK